MELSLRNCQLNKRLLPARVIDLTCSKKHRGAKYGGEFETEFVLYIGRYELYLKTRWNEQVNFKNLWKVIKHPPRNCEFDMFISDNALNCLL